MVRSVLANDPGLGYLERIGYTGAREPTPLPPGGAGPDFEHALLLVEAGERLIADVGFGDSFIEPLPLEGTREMEQQGSVYRLGAEGSRRILQRRQPAADWEPQFSFTLTPRRLAEFAAECRRLQTSPESPFTRKAVCSLPTPDGRITLSGGRLIRTARGRREEEPVAGTEEYRGDRAPHVARRRLTQACGGDSHLFQTGADRPCGRASISR